MVNCKTKHASLHSTDWTPISSSMRVFSYALAWRDWNRMNVFNILFQIQCILLRIFVFLQHLLVNVMFSTCDTISDLDTVWREKDFLYMTKGEYVSCKNISWQWCKNFASLNSLISRFCANPELHFLLRYYIFL